MSDDKTSSPPQARMHTLRADHDDPHGAQPWLAEKLSQPPEAPDDKIDAVLIVVFKGNALTYATFGVVSKADSTYLAAVLNHAAVCTACDE